MFRPQLVWRPRPELCQICAFARVGHPNTAKRSFATPKLGSRPSSKISQEISGDRPAGSIPRYASAAKGTASAASGASLRQRLPKKNLPDLESLVAAVARVKTLFFQQEGIPSEASTAAALRTCVNAADRLMGSPQMERISDTTASTLLSLDTNGRRAIKSESHGEDMAMAFRLRNTINEISETASAIIHDKNVFITPQILELYVNIQARLGKPEVLPQAFLLYASKPQPRGSAGSIKYVSQRPNKIANAVDTKVAETALDAAIEAKNLDAAVAIVESTYSTKAFIRARILKKALLPTTIFVSVPFAAYFGAFRLAELQNTMDPSTATSVAFAGIVAYVGFTAAIGIVAATTANDHMKRVTWLPGTPLRQRWICEEERVALDKIACSFGFSEMHRYGEEVGTQFQALREYILRKGMILDQVELMEGMGG